MNRLFINAFGVTPQTSNWEKCFITVWKISRRNLVVYHNFSVFQTLKKIKICAVSKLGVLLTERNASSGTNGNNNEKKPNILMNFQPVLRPDILLSIKNWILAKFIIQPYLDNDFTITDFTRGAKQSLVIVSSLLSKGEFSSLKELVTEDAVTEIKNNFSVLSVKERQDLLVKFTDIFFGMPYQIGIMFDDSNQRRFAEISVVYHCINDFEEKRNQGRILKEDIVKEDLKICNYRFIREYTKGVESDWTINRLGHFKLSHFGK